MNKAGDGFASAWLVSNSVQWKRRQQSAQIDNMLKNARYFWPFDPIFCNPDFVDEKFTIANNVYDPIYQIIVKLSPLL